MSYLIKQLNQFEMVGFYSWKYPMVSAREFLIEERAWINDDQLTGSFNFLNISTNFVDISTKF